MMLPSLNKGVGLRAAKAADAEAIALVHIRAWQKAYESYIPESILSSLSLSERTKQWLELIQKGVSIIVLEKKGRILGFASICKFRDGYKDDLSGEISAIYLHPDYWRKGYGTKLCLAALNGLCYMGYKTALLWVLADNLQARLFYQNLGFEATDETKLEEFYEGGALLTEILYSKDLGIHPECK